MQFTIVSVGECLRSSRAVALTIWNYFLVCIYQLLYGVLERLVCGIVLSLCCYESFWVSRLEVVALGPCPLYTALRLSTVIVNVHFVVSCVHPSQN